MTVGDGAAYNPTTRAWRQLPAAPISARAGHVAVWTGREMIIWGGYGECCPIDSTLHSGTGAAYDPSSNRWRRIADGPAPWSGDDGREVALAHDGRMFVWRHGQMGVYDPAKDAWTEIAGAPAMPSPQSITTGDPLAIGAAVDDTLAVWTGGYAEDTFYGLSVDPDTATWRKTKAVSGVAFATFTEGSGRFFVAPREAEHLLQYDFKAESWAKLPPSGLPARSRPTLVWTETELLMWGGYTGAGPVNDGAAYRPQG